MELKNHNIQLVNSVEPIGKYVFPIFDLVQSREAGTVYISPSLESSLRSGTATWLQRLSIDFFDVNYHDLKVSDSRYLMYIYADPSTGNLLGSLGTIRNDDPEPFVSTLISDIVNDAFCIYERSRYSFDDEFKLLSSVWKPFDVMHKMIFSKAYRHTFVYVREFNPFSEATEKMLQYAEGLKNKTKVHNTASAVSHRRENKAQIVIGKLGERLSRYPGTYCIEEGVVKQTNTNDMAFRRGKIPLFHIDGEGSITYYAGSKPTRNETLFLKHWSLKTEELHMSSELRKLVQST